MVRNIIADVAEQLGQELYMACASNNVAKVQVLTSNNNSTNWSVAAIAAASEGAADVASYCFRDPSTAARLKDGTLWWVIAHEALDPAYHFLVESKLVDVNHDMERTGTVLGVVAGQSKDKRHALVEYMLQKGALPNQRVESEGGWYALTGAAGHSDPRMIELFLDYGAQIQGTSALSLAALTGKEENVKCLLDRGADVNEMAPLTHFPGSRENMGPPLHKAVEKGHAGVVDILLNAGADVTLKDAKGRTAADVAREKGIDAAILAKVL